MNLIATFTTILLTLAILDFLWLGLIAKDIYTSQLASLLKPTNFFATFLIYLSLAIGTYFFVLQNINTNSPLQALIVGALFGIIVYGIYNLTNFALIKNWPIKIVIIDILWGTILLGLTSFVAKHVQNLVI